MKKLLIIAALTGFTALTAGQYIEANFEDDELHLNIKDGAHADTNMQYYLDVDNNVDTGYTSDGITKGADYLIENGAFFKYTGNGSNWEWDEFGGDWEYETYDVYVPLDEIELDVKSTIKVGAIAWDDDWDISYIYNKYGADENQMKLVTVSNNPLTIEHRIPSGVSAKEAADALVKAVNSYENQDNNGKKDWQVLRIEKVKTASDGYAKNGHEKTEGNYLAVKGNEDHPHTFIMKICNGRYADGLLEHESDRPISMMMPCTLTVYERGGKVYIATMNAENMMPLISAFSENAQNLLMKTSNQMEEMVQNALSNL